MSKILRSSQKVSRQNKYYEHKNAQIPSEY